MLLGLGQVDWGQVASASTAISSAVQSGANAYTSVNNAVNTKPTSNSAAVQQILQPAGNGGGKPEEKDNTLMYVAIGGLGLLLVGGIVAFVATRKKKIK